MPMPFLSFLGTLIKEYRLPVYKPVVIVTQRLTCREIRNLSFKHYVIMRYFSVWVVIWSKCTMNTFEKTYTQLCDILVKFHAFRLDVIPSITENLHHFAIGNLVYQASYRIPTTFRLLSFVLRIGLLTKIIKIALADYFFNLTTWKLDPFVININRYRL